MNTHSGTLFREIDALSGEATLWDRFFPFRLDLSIRDEKSKELPPFQKVVCSKKEIVYSCWEQILLEKSPFQKRLGVQESKQEVTKANSLVKI